MILIIIAAWIICTLITYVIIEAEEPDVDDEKVSTMAVCFGFWWLLLTVFIGEKVFKIVFKELSKVGDFIGGFIAGLFGNRK